MASFWTVQLFFSIYWKLVMAFATGCLLDLHTARRLDLAAPASSPRDPLPLCFAVASSLPLLLSHPALFRTAPWLLVEFSDDEIAGAVGVLLVAVERYRQYRRVWGRPRRPAEPLLLVCVVLLLASLPGHWLLRLPSGTAVRGVYCGPRKETGSKVCATLMAVEWVYVCVVFCLFWMKHRQEKAACAARGLAVHHTRTAAPVVDEPVVDDACSDPICGDEAELVD